MRWVTLGVLVVAALVVVAWRSRSPVPPVRVDASAIVVSTTHAGEVSVVTRSPALLVSDCGTLGGVLSGELRLSDVPAFLNAERIYYDGASCGCTSVLLDSTLISVGSEHGIAGGSSVLSTQSVLGRGSVGERSSTVRFRVKSAGGNTTPVVWAHSQRILADAEALPDMLAVTFSAANSPTLKRAVKLTAHTRSPSLPVVAVATADDGAEITAIRNPTPVTSPEPGVWRHEWNVELLIRPLPRDNLDADVRRVSLSLDGVGRVTIPVSVRRVFGVEAPSSLHFGTTVARKSVTKRLVLRSCDGRPFRVLPSPPGGVFSVSKCPDQPGIRQIVDLTYDPKSEGEHSDTLIVRTDHPDSSELSIAVRGASRSATGEKP